MRLCAQAAVGVVAALHVWFMVLESFLWDTPFGRGVFGTTAEYAKASRVLAANQGLYNGFLAVGLIWGLCRGGAEGAKVQIFFLGCVIVAGIVGGVTASRGILFIQALPGALALALVLASR